jgi:hypothetical protein
MRDELLRSDVADHTSEPPAPRPLLKGGVTLHLSSADATELLPPRVQVFSEGAEAVGPQHRAGADLLHRAVAAKADTRKTKHVSSAQSSAPERTGAARARYLGHVGACFAIGHLGARRDAVSARDVHGGALGKTRRPHSPTTNKVLDV